MTDVEATNARLVQINDVLGDLVEDVGRRAALKSQGSHIYGDVHYDYIPFDHAMFTDALLSVKGWLAEEGFFTEEKGCPRFVDVGCGIGDKVKLAEHLGFDAYGLDYDPLLLRYAGLLFYPKSESTTSNGGPRLIHQCALRHKYEESQVIYFYQPFQDDDLQTKLERRIYRQAALGTFIITPQCVTHPSQRMFVTCDGYGNEAMATEDTVMIFRRVRKGKESMVFRI